MYHTVSSYYITIIYVSEDEDFDVEEEDVRRIVRKSLEPDHETAYPDDDEGNETEFPDSSEIFTNQEKTQIDDEDMEFNQMLDAAIEEIRNFVPKRKRKDNKKVGNGVDPPTPFRENFQNFYCSLFFYPSLTY